MSEEDHRRNPAAHWRVGPIGKKRHETWHTKVCPPAQSYLDFVCNMGNGWTMISTSVEKEKRKSQCLFGWWLKDFFHLSFVFVCRPVIIAGRHGTSRYTTRVTHTHIVVVVDSSFVVLPFSIAGGSVCNRSTAPLVQLLLLLSAHLFCDALPIKILHFYRNRFRLQVCLQVPKNVWREKQH